MICGGMFCGKTEELLRRLRRVEIAGKVFQVFKPAVDTRYDTDSVVSHNQAKIRADVIANAEEIIARLMEDTEVVAIDEAQFFDNAIIKVYTPASLI